MSLCQKMSEGVAKKSPNVPGLQPAAKSAARERAGRRLKTWGGAEVPKFTLEVPKFTLEVPKFTLEVPKLCGA